MIDSLLMISGIVDLPPFVSVEPMLWSCFVSCSQEFNGNGQLLGTDEGISTIWFRIAKELGERERGVFEARATKGGGDLGKWKERSRDLHACPNGATFGTVQALAERLSLGSEGSQSRYILPGVQPTWLSTSWKGPITPMSMTRGRTNMEPFKATREVY